jgi:uncharacterized protein (TIGR02145 family)
MRLFFSLAFLLSAALYGQNNYSMSFDGNSGDNVEINNFAGLSNDITITGWVLFTDSTNQDCIIEKHESINGGFPTPTGWWLRKEQRKLRWLGTTVNGSMNNESSINLPIGSYVFVAATYDGVSSKLYINGVDCSGSGQTLSNPGGNIISNSRSIVMGMGRWGAQNNGIYTTMLLDGNISEISIWNTALTQEQIQQYMNCPPSGDEEGLVGYWNFDEGEGDTVYDLSDNGNDGEVIGATYSTDVPELNCVLCIDPVACNYNPYAIEDDGSCDYTCCPGPGCCTNGMYWDWDLQGCLNINPTDTNLDGCTDLNDLMDILANYGDCAVAEFTCGDDIEHEGYSYSTVQIGDQCWFSENCRYLPEVSSLAAWSFTDPYYYVYDYQGTDVEEAIATDNYETYGVLYNWPAVMTEGVCPTSWHVPSDEEWQSMEMFLGMSPSEASSAGWRGTDEGYQMKSTSGWDANGNGSNSSGFNGLPGGLCDSNDCRNFGYYGYWRSSSESGSYSWMRELGSYHDYVNRTNFNHDYGLSARCIKD